MDSVSAEVNGPLTASVAVDNLYVGGGFGGGTLPDPITVTFGENAALNAENTSSSGGINIGGLIGYNSVGSLDLRGSKLVNKADSALTISAKAIASIHIQVNNNPLCPLFQECRQIRSKAISLQ